MEESDEPPSNRIDRSKVLSTDQVLADTVTQLTQLQCNEAVTSEVAASSEDDRQQGTLASIHSPAYDSLLERINESKETTAATGGSKQKSVYFHSATGQPGAEKKITNAIDCLQYMINGSTMVKVKASTRQYRRFYTLEEDLTMIRWVPSTKKTSKARLFVKSVREVRPGRNTEVLKSQDISGIYSEDRTFSIIYGEEFDSIDLIASSPEEANIWVTGLNFLIGLIKSPDSLEGREKMREKWLLDMFDEADSEHKGMLDELETIALLKKLNDRLCIRSLKQKIVEFERSKKNGEQRGCISKHAFISLFTQTATRPDVYFILVRYCGRDYMTVEELQLFLEGEQGITGTTLDSCRELIARFEPSVEAHQQKKLLIDGFTQFLLSDACDIGGMSSKQITQDMTQPFAHYFIASSYNTYLIEDQVKGPSSCEGYVQALQSGCRCVKIDCHDGPDGPLVYNTNTLTSKIALIDVLTTIRDNAFVASPYPVIINLQNHCTVPMQKLVATLFREAFGEQLYLPPEVANSSGSDISSTNSNEMKPKSPSVSSASSDDGDHIHSSQQSIDTSSSVSSGASKQQPQYYPGLSSGLSNTGNGSIRGTTDATTGKNQFWQRLSPAQLQNKFIILGKKISNRLMEEEEISDEEVEISETKDSKRRVVLCRELSDLVTLVRVEASIDLFSAVSHRLAKNTMTHFDECLATKLSNTHPEELAQRNKASLGQVTPSISRIDSSNLNALDFWSCGFQLISMNYQTHGQIMNLYHGWFSQNGSCGYVLKPPFLREKYFGFNFRRKDVMPGIDPLNIRIKIISGQQLPRPRGASLKASSIDPYVIVQCLGVPADCAESRTRTVSNDGHNPIFDESFEFNVSVPELALIRFLVLDDDFINDDFIGQLTVPVTSLHPGYKHVRLQSTNGETISNAILFVKISITKRYGSKQKLRRKRSWAHKNIYEAKQTGNKNIDEQMKIAFGVVHDAIHNKRNVEKSILDLCDECSLPESANMAQCLRIITLRMASCPSVISCKVLQSDQGYPCLRVTGELTPKLNRTIIALDRALLDFHQTITNSKEQIKLLAQTYKQFSKVNYEYNPSNKESSNLFSQIMDNIRGSKFRKESESLEPSATGERTVDSDKPEKLRMKFSFGSVQNIDDGIRHSTVATSASAGNSPSVAATSAHSSPNFRTNRKSEKTTENMFWNLCVIKTELDNLHTLRNDCQNAFSQMRRIAESLEHIFEREHKVILRSNSHVVREISSVSHCVGYGSDSETKLSPAISNEGQLRGILKKTTSPSNRSGHLSPSHCISIDENAEYGDDNRSLQQANSGSNIQTLADYGYNPNLYIELTKEFDQDKQH